MSDLQQVIRERDDITGKVKPHKTPKWIKQANKSIKIWEKIMKRRYPIKWRLLMSLRFNIGI